MLAFTGSSLYSVIQRLARRRRERLFGEYLKLNGAPLELNYEFEVRLCNSGTDIADQDKVCFAGTFFDVFGDFN